MCLRWRRWSWRALQSWKLMLLLQELVILLLLKQSSLLILINNPEGHLFMGLYKVSFFFFFLPLFNQMLKLNALSGSHISVCAGEFSFAGLFGYLHSDLSTHPYFWLKQSNNHIFWENFFICMNLRTFLSLFIQHHVPKSVFFRSNPQYRLLDWKQTGNWLEENFGCWQGDLSWHPPLNIIITLIETIAGLYGFYKVTFLHFAFHNKFKVRFLFSQKL